MTAYVFIRNDMAFIKQGTFPAFTHQADGLRNMAISRSGFSIQDGIGRHF